MKVIKKELERKKIEEVCSSSLWREKCVGKEEEAVGRKLTEKERKRKKRGKR